MSEPLKTDMTRREIVGALARWTVPTVVTISLGSRSLLAMAPSCPPCTRITAGKCKSCSVSQILNCQCEPCLGAPYCSGGGPGGPVTSVAPGSGPGSPATGGRSAAPSLPQLGDGSYQDQRISEPMRSGGLRGFTQTDPLAAPLYREPFAAERRYQGLGRSPFGNSSLYGRLRGDSIAVRRRP